MLENVVILIVVVDEYRGGKRICCSDLEFLLAFSCEGHVGLGYGR